MEQNHLTNQLDDLEQKYQNSQAQIARLQQRVETQEYQLQEQTQQIEQLKEELVKSKAELARAPQVDTQLAHFKDEMLQMMEQRYGRRQAAGTDTNSNLVMQQLDNHTEALNQLRRDVEKTHRFDEQISLARAEMSRLNKEVQQLQTNLNDLSRQLDERVKSLNYVEDQRRATARTLAELQAELPELHKKTEANLTKIQLIEQKSPQFTKYEAALDSLREEIRRHREHMDFQVAQRERQLKNWSELAETTEQRLKQNEALMEKYAEHYQLNKRALASLQDFQERLQREQHRFGELQRLTEERQRTELEKFQADYEQRWKKQSMELDPQFNDVQKSLANVKERLDELSKLHQLLEEQMQMVLQILEEDIQARSVAIADWQARFEELANGQP